MVTEIYNGVTIRKYGTRRGESVYPLCFTDNLDKKDVTRKVVMHETWEDAREYIDNHS
jgi:hypothetical protein